MKAQLRYLAITSRVAKVASEHETLLEESRLIGVRNIGFSEADLESGVKQCLQNLRYNRGQCDTSVAAWKQWIPSTPFVNRNDDTTFQECLERNDGM